jgi:protein-tyrosine phosphatase
MLPGIDDGAQTLAVSLEMARMAADDGITTTFCTPHIYPGLYENKGPDIKRRVEHLQLILRDKGIPLMLNFGADAHLVPELLEGVSSGRVPTLAASRYLLLEPPHHVRPPGFTDSVFRVITAGYTPVITHPERLSWYGAHVEDFLSLARSGAWLQVTGGALIGRFGPVAQRHAEHLVADGWCDVLASDGHTITRRAPVLSAARARAAELVGSDEANAMTLDRPQLVLNYKSALSVPRPPAHTKAPQNRSPLRRIVGSLADRLLGRSHESSGG